MITNFEIETAPLTEDEKLYIPIIIKGLSTKSKDKAIKSDAIVKALNEKYTYCKMTGARLRKITNFIRSEGILPIIATSNGYYVSYDEEEIKSQIVSLLDRAQAIINSANGLKKFLNIKE
jgi:hypothetical protein